MAPTEGLAHDALNELLDLGGLPRGLAENCLLYTSPSPRD